MSERRVILVNRVYWPSTSATAQLLTDLAEGLAGRGWSVHVICAGDRIGSRHGVTLHPTFTSVNHGGLLSRVLNHRTFQRAVRRRLQELVRPGDVVVPMTDPPLLATTVARAVPDDVRVVPWIQDIYPEIAAVHFGGVTSRLLLGSRAGRNAAWKKGARCATLGEGMAQTVAAGGVTPDRIALIPNWAPRELDVTPTPAAVAEVRRLWGVNDRFVVGYSGNLGRVHEFSTVLAAAEKLRKVSNLLFLFVGNGARLAEVTREVQQRKLENVRFLPPVPREALPESLAAVDVQLVTLRPEYAQLVYPSKLAGALASGRPVLFVGPGQDEIARLLRQYECGAAFSPDNAIGLAETIQRWQADAALTARLGVNARRLYAERFTAADGFARWARLLESTWKEPSTPPIPPPNSPA